MKKKPRVGFLGLGIMGSPMAHNLLKAGFPVTVWNRTGSKMAPLVAVGADAAGSPAEAAANADVLVSIVTDTPDVAEILFGENGAARTLSPGSVAVDMSTISPVSAASFARTLARRRIGFLDAPVTGGQKGAIEGTLTIMAGGRATDLKKAMPVLSAMGARVLHMGPWGAGQTTKLANQIVCALNTLAAAEGLAFARKAGLDPARVHAAISGGAAASWSLTNLGKKILDGDLEPAFRMRLLAKDLRIVGETLDRLGLELPGARLASRLYRQGCRKGLGEKGTQAIVRLLGK
ncbi:MAG: NAD(P)-dependent oxidoreductase [Planctomycetota bacterium]